MVGSWRAAEERQEDTNNDWEEEEKFLKQDQVRSPPLRAVDAVSVVLISRSLCGESKRRLRHLTAVMIKNLTQNPKRDEISTFLSQPFPDSSNLSSQKPSSTTATVPTPTRRRLQFASDDVDLHLRTRRRATSNASLRPVFKAPTIEELRNESTEDYFPATTTDGPPLTFPTPPAGILRRRSTSRASMMSVASNGSGSTIRAGGSLLDRPVDDDEGRTASGVASDLNGMTLQEEVASGRVSYASEVLLVKEKRRRVEMLRRRLVDCFITLSIPPPDAGDGEVPESRRRGTSISSPSGSGRSKLSRTDSTNSVKRNRRSSTLSASNVPPKTAPTSPPPPPFYVSQPTHAKIHPTFDIDRQDLLVEDPDEWTGLRDGRVVVGVWVAEPSEVAKSGEGDWKLLVEWDVELAGLVSLGRDPHAFPALPPNTLIFAINSTYYTARSHSVVPKPSFHYSDSSPDESSDVEDGNLSDPGVSRQTSRSKKSQASRRVT